MVAWWLVACQTDLLGNMGLEPTMPAPSAQTTEVAAEPEPAPSAEDVAPEPAPAASAEPAAEPAAAPPPAPVEFNPISMPMGPREDGGVRWEGVSKKYNADPDKEIIPQD